MSDDLDGQPGIDGCWTPPGPTEPPSRLQAAIAVTVIALAVILVAVTLLL